LDRNLHSVPASAASALSVVKPWLDRNRTAVVLLGMAGRLWLFVDRQQLVNNAS
jgi:hypothetical protein